MKNPGVKIYENIYSGYFILHLMVILDMPWKPAEPKYIIMHVWRSVLVWVACARARARKSILPVAQRRHTVIASIFRRVPVVVVGGKAARRCCPAVAKQNGFRTAWVGIIYVCCGVISDVALTQRCRPLCQRLINRSVSLFSFPYRKIPSQVYCLRFDRNEMFWWLLHM